MSAMDTFITIDEQIETIERKGIAVGDREFARRTLLDVSYYALINGYGEAFCKEKCPAKTYLEGTSFESILGLYHIDQRIRWILIHYLFEAESSLKNRIVYGFLSFRDPASGADDLGQQYLNASAPGYDQTNWRLKGFVDQLGSLINEGKKDSQAVRHSVQSYGYVPLWVLETLFRFGDVRHFYQCCNPAIRASVASGFSVSDSFLNACIRVLHVARNCCAHRGRLYRFDPGNGTFGFVFPSKGSQDAAVERILRSGLSSKGLSSVAVGLRVALPEPDYRAAVSSIYEAIAEGAPSVFPLSESDLLAMYSLPSKEGMLYNP